MEPKNQTQHLEERLKLLESILDDSRDIIVVGDEHGKAIEFNKGAEIFLGYSRDEVLGKPISMFYFNPPDRKQVESALKEKGSLVDYNIRLKTKEGKMFHASTTLSYLRDDSNHIVGTIGIAKNIGERKRQEKRNSIRMFVNLSILILVTGLAIAGTYLGTTYLGSNPLVDHLKKENTRLSQEIEKANGELSKLGKLEKEIALAKSHSDDECSKIKEEMALIKAQLSQKEKCLDEINNCRFYIPQSVVGKNIVVLKKELPFTRMLSALYWAGTLKEIKNDCIIIQTIETNEPIEIPLKEIWGYKVE
ncbi:MAG: PAS domain S-box protein [Planctomycetes bacterium]|nr:PAS domain S-box protein [Planctomycetota bacterium]